MKRYKVTLDTGPLVKHKVEKIDLTQLLKGKPVEVSIVSVSLRENKGKLPGIKIQKLSETFVWDDSSWDEGSWASEVPEVAVCGEAVCGKSRLGSLSSADRFEEILKLISSGGFPSQDKRANLSKGQRSQLRDAIIFNTHVDNGGEIFVTTDGDFIKNGVREKLEKAFNTKIQTVEEFQSWLETLTDQDGSS